MRLRLLETLRRLTCFRWGAELAGSPTQTSEYIQFIASTYRNDFTGYRLDVLGRSKAECWEPVERSVVENKRTAVGSGHGIGKTAFGADLIHWFISTRPHPAIVATANTEDQLQKKLWRELYRTNQQAKNKDWFDWKASTFTMFNNPTQQAVALAWSENNSEAFAGTHEDHVLGVFDEASAIARVIFNVFKGAMTTPGARWVLLGNSTQSEGYFYDAVHGKLKARKAGDAERGQWNSFVIPSWASPFVTEEFIREYELSENCDRNGDPKEWSDEFRVRVAGLPPRFDATQFIPRELVLQAMGRSIDLFPRWPLVLGIDVGHTNDRSVIVPRRGRKVLDNIRVVRGSRTTDFAREIVNEIKFYRDDMGVEANCVIEEVGMGVGVVETVQDMGYWENVSGIQPGTTDGVDTELYANLRAQMWAEMKEWLEGNVELPNNPELNDDLVVVKRKSSGKRNNLLLESKDELRRRGVKSPDMADALALTFAVPFDLLPERRRDNYDDYREPATSGATWMGN